MTLTKEQKEVIEEFRKRYFSEHPGYKPEVSLSQFMDKTKEEQMTFIKQWGTQFNTHLSTLKTNLETQLTKVNKMISDTQKALTEQW